MKAKILKIQNLNRATLYAGLAPFLAALFFRLYLFGAQSANLNAPGAALFAFFTGFLRDLTVAALLSIPAVIYLILRLLRSPDASNSPDSLDTPEISGDKTPRFIFLRVWAVFTVGLTIILCATDLVFFTYNARRIGFEFFTLGQGDLFAGLHTAWFGSPGFFIVALVLLCVTAAFFVVVRIGPEVRKKSANALFGLALGLGMLAPVAHMLTVEKFNDEPLYFELEKNVPANLVLSRVRLFFLPEFMEEKAALLRVRALFPPPGNPRLAGKNPFFRQADPSAATPVLHQAAGIQNIVFLVLEGVSGLDINARNTPEIYAAKTRGRYYPNFFANGLRTRNALVSILTGWPDIVNYSAIKTHAAFHRFSSLPEFLGSHGFRSIFLYGGDPAFEYYNRFLKRIGFDELRGKAYLKKIYPDADTGAFGRSFHDDVLMKELIRILRDPAPDNKKRFITALTLSTHAPYLLPPNAERANEDRVSNSGPAGQDTYSRYLRTLRFADRAIGEFLKKAGEEAWGAGTLIVLTADHTHHQGLQGVNRFRVPLLIIGPGFSPGINPVVGGQIDFLPTIQDIFGRRPGIYTAGVSLLAKSFHQGFAFLNGGNYVALVDRCGSYRVNQFNRAFLPRLAPIRPGDQIYCQRQINPRHQKSNLMAFFQLTRNYLLHNKIRPTF